MANQAQLEIISPSGEIEFYDLDPGRGITNIGRDPENDIVVAGPGIASFHAQIDHRQRPFQVMLLSETGQAVVGGQSLSPNIGRDIHNWDTIELDGYSIVLLEGEQPLADLGPAPVAALQPAVPSMPEGEAPAPAATGVVAQPYAGPRLTALPPDRIDSLIVVELSDREWTIDVEQTATCQVTVINGGDVVAEFHVAVEGVDPEWVTVSSPQFNLTEREQRGVTVSITPPRETASRAGVHYLAIAVSSPLHYPGAVSRLGATLTLNPYYEYAVGDLRPRQQRVSWSRHYGGVELPVTNRGNAVTAFRVDGRDDEQACQFEFRVPGEEVTLAQQAELRLGPGEACDVPVRITPPRRLIGMGRHTYSYTLTTSVLEGALTPRAVMGQVRVAPLIGPVFILLMALLLALAVVLVFRPEIDSFGVEPGVVNAGEPVTLSWQVSRFARPSVDQNVGQVAGPEGKATTVPAEGTSYQLEARNWLSLLSPRFFLPTAQVRVEVTPVLPDIRVFSVDRNQILVGETVRVSWEVRNADEVILEVNGNPETLRSDEHSSQRQFEPVETTSFVLRASNRYGPDSKSQEVIVLFPTATPIPTATPLPTPYVQVFSVQPLEVVEGEGVTVDWTVINVDSVSIEPISAGLPNGGQLQHFPDTTTQYILTASNGQPGGDVRRLIEVGVKPAPTPTPEPQAPVIEFFRLTQDQVVLGDGDEVDLTWSVVGETTNIQIGGPDFGPVSGLPALGTMPFKPTEAKAVLFVLTAFNGDLSASATAKLDVLEPTPTPTPEPPPTATPAPPSIVFFQASAANSDDDDKVTFVGSDPPTYEVIAGTKVNLDWLTQNAVQVELFVDGSSLGNQDLSGPLPRIIREDGNYLLTATNSQGDTANASLRIEAQPYVPSTPYNLNGIPMTDTIRIEWEYNFVDENNIVGFRLYRAEAPPGKVFKRVADERDLDPGTRDWMDSKDLTETCGKAYYLVAVYIDFNGNLLETDSSTTSWYSDPCHGQGP